MDFKKSSSSGTNTYCVYVLGVATEAVVDGKDDICLRDVRIQFTSDHEGESLSLSGKFTYTVPYEAVEMLVDHTRKQRGVTNNAKQ